MHVLMTFTMTTDMAELEETSSGSDEKTVQRGKRFFAKGLRAERSGAESFCYGATSAVY